MVAENSGYHDVAAGTAACSQGLVVPQPEANPGLVEDCRTLFELRDTLAGGTVINWTPTTEMAEWDGVIISGSPARVTGLDFTPRDSEVRLQLVGSLPAGLGSLTELRRLSMYGSMLSGTIPPELGNLTKLEHLSLSLWHTPRCIPQTFPEIWVKDLGLECC